MEIVNFRLDEVLRHNHEMFINLAVERGIELILKIADNVPLSLSGNPARLGQVLNNLTSNAIKFTEKGRIIVNVNCIERKDTGAVIEFSVSDTGMGIDKEMLGRLLTAFTQTDSSIDVKYLGTGLGLAISSRLVKMMGGLMNAESETGEGSTFTFTASFRIAEFDRERIASEKIENDNDMQRLKGLKILVVDDNIINQELTVKILKHAGIIAEVANNGHEAVEMAANSSFDAVLMDVQMPGIDGYTATRMIRKDNRFNNLPIIAL